MAHHGVYSRIIARGTTTIRWTPAHQGVKGDEEADTRAKATAEGSSQRRLSRPPRAEPTTHNDSSDRNKAPNHERVDLEPYEGQQALSAPEGWRDVTGASAGEGGAGRAILPVPDRTRLDQLPSL